MTTWAQIRSDIRADLKDTSATSRWSDDVLYLYTKDAIRDYSLYFPLVVHRQTLTESNGTFALPTDFMSVTAVESPQDTYLERRIERPGAKFYSRSYQPTTYYIEGLVMYLNAEATDEVLLSYDAWHPVPSAADDDTFVLTFPEYDEELIRLYVRAKAIEQVRSQQANLDRFRPGAGDRQDNPLAPEVKNLMADYQRKIAERFPGGYVRLYRPGYGR